MMKRLLAIMVLGILLLPAKAHAIEDPLNHPNNRFGIHVLHEDDIEEAEKLVNSEGGDWGYVTLVIREDELNPDRWQKFFDRLREAHLIPIVRIASSVENGVWRKLDKGGIDGWINFLNSLNWVTKNRYIVVGNEPNHAKEWGGEVNPEEYADYLVEFSQKAKNASNDFFILPAGFDASAPNDKEHMDEKDFLNKVVIHKPDFFEYVDGWTSHSYPNPNFSGNINDSGKGSIRTYEWEMDYLKALGLRKKLPIFITETGWAHDANGEVKAYSSDEIVSKNLKAAYQEVWDSPDIVAITPFVLSYTGAPFNIFSWINEDGQFYSFYETVKNLPKSPGLPKQIHSAYINAEILPEVVKRKNGIFGIAIVTNTGQSIWESAKPVLVETNEGKFVIEPLEFFKHVFPFSKSFVYIKSPEISYLPKSPFANL